jgi:hypothetical protein
MSDARVTSVQLEALVVDAPEVRVTSVQLEVLTPDQPALEYDITATALQVVHDDLTPADVGASQLGAEAISAEPADIGATQVGVEALTGGEATAEVTQAGVEVLWKGSPEVFAGCTAADVKYRVRLRLPGAEEDLAQFTSLPGGTNNVIVSPPRIDASSVDVLKGATTIGGCSFTLSDPQAGECSAPDPTDRLFTRILADAGAQFQLLGARLFIEATESDDPEEEDWLPYWAGYVAAVRYVDAITVEVIGSHSTRDDETTQVWRELSAEFGSTGAIMGGVLIGTPYFPSDKPGVEASKFTGYWQARVTAVASSHVTLDIDEDASVPFPPADIKPFLADRGFLRSGSNNDAQRNVFKWVERNMAPYAVSGYPDPLWKSALSAASIRSWFPRLICQCITKNASVFPRAFQILSAGGGIVTPQGYTATNRPFSGDLGGGFKLFWTNTNPEPQPNVNDLLTFYVRPLDVSEANPLLIIDHPVDILTKLWDTLDIEYDAPSAAAVKAAIGAFVVALRITQPMTLKAAQEMLCGAFGFAWRYAPDGKRYLFTTRVRPPVVGTITLDDLRSPNGVVWEGEESSRVFSVSYEWQRFVSWPGEEDGSNVDRSLDGIKAYPMAPITFQTSDIGSKPFGSRDESYKVPGAVMVLAGSDEAPDYSYSDHVEVTAKLAAPLLEQFGRGAIMTTLDLGPCIAAQEGEDWLLELPHRPGFDAGESPVAQRGLVERVQVIARVPQPWGSTVTFIRVPQDQDAIEDVEVEAPALVTIDETTTATPGSTDFELELDDDTNYAANGIRVEVESAVLAPDGVTFISQGVQLWDGTSPLIVGPFPPGSTAYYRTRLRYQDGAVGPWGAYQAVPLNAGEGQAGGDGLQTPTIVLAVSGGWVVSAEVVGGPDAVKAYCLSSNTAFPTVASLLASTPDTTTPFSFASLDTLAEGETAFVSAITEDANGNISLIAVALFTRPDGNSGGGGGSDTTARALAHHALFLHHRVI